MKNDNPIVLEFQRVHKKVFGNEISYKEAEQQLHLLAKIISIIQPKPP
ncbi:hypothetical protein KDA00_01765 [Candidatus Saccharibacteria bacterium]|nr:hypothetical protein [Candidatus Saccharibacteria bacterium]